MSTDERAVGDSGDEMMDATYRALCDHGYANLTMQDIADELGKSKSLLHYHYDTKRDLLEAFLEHIVDRFAAEIRETEADDPEGRLNELLDRFVFGDEDVESRQFHLALLELRSQVPHDESYRAQFVRSDDAVRDAIVSIVEDGIEEGVFREVDPEETAALIFAALDGARMRQVTLADGAYTATVRDALRDHVVADLLAEEPRS